MRRLSNFARRGLAIAVGVVLLVATVPAVNAGSPPSLVKDINPTGSSNPTEMTRVGNTLFFAAHDGVHGVELWKSDGTAAGTRMVKNIRPYGRSSHPQNLVNVDGALFFTAADGIHGRELWKSDGTATGTVMVKDIHTGPVNQPGGNGTWIHERIVPIGKRVFFMVDECCLGTQRLFVSDGTAVGTYELERDSEFVLPDEFSVGAASGHFYFTVFTSAEGEPFMQLWMTDGTQDGTRPVPGAPTPDRLSILPAAGQNLYFVQSTAVGLPPETAHWLWRTNGTRAGTRRLTSLHELAGVPEEAVYMRGRIYFADAALWKTNGTVTGTRRISTGYLSSLTAANGRLYFTRNLRLWTSDGTAAGTHGVMNFTPLYPRDLIGVGDLAMFAVQDWEETTWSLWRSNGTNVGTRRVASFEPYSAELGLPRVAVRGTLFFAADDGSRGTELWRYTP